MPLSERAPADAPANTPTKASQSVDDAILEAWGQGFNVGSLVILILLVLCNYRRHVLLHKLILLEVRKGAANSVTISINGPPHADTRQLFFALWHGTFIFCHDPVYGWYLSSTATLLFISYQLHNIISWRKIKPFLPRWGHLTFIITIIAVQPFWIVEAWNNFEYFNGLGNQSNIRTRPWEALVRDPWWIFTTLRLLHVLKTSYSFTFFGLIRTSPRFAVMLFCMFLSLIFLIMDVIVTVTHIARNSGINPYWRLALVFKCASDTIFLDDFKRVLDHIVSISLTRIGSATDTNPRRPSFPLRASVSTTQTAPPRIGPIVTIRANSKVKDDSHRHLSSWNLFRGGSKPKLHIRRETTITSSNEPSELENNSGGHTHRTNGFEELFLAKPQAARTRRATVNQWGDSNGIEEGSLRVKRPKDGAP